MDNDIVEFSAENNEKMLLTPGDGGVIISILPATNLLGQTAYDIFEIGLRKSSLKSLSRALHKEQKYSTDYYQNIIWRDKLKKIHFHNKTKIRELPEYNCTLDADQSIRFIRWVDYYANGLPTELSAFTAVQDLYVQNQLVKVIENPSLLNIPEYWDELGMSLGTANFADEAMNCFRKALQLDPEHYASKLNMAVSLDEIGKSSEALDLISKVPDEIGRRNVIMANTLCSAGMEIEAIPYYEKAVVEEPDFFVPYLRLLSILSSNDHPLFEYWLEKALDNHRTVPAIAHFYTDLLLQQQRIEELAEIDWLDDLKNVPSNLGVIGRDTDDPIYIALSQLNHKIALIYRDGDDQDLPLVSHQLSNIPDEWNICMQSKLLAGAAVQSGHPELIPAIYERVCPSCREEEIGVPRHVDTMLAKAYEIQGNWDQAIIYCEKVLATDPKHTKTLNIYYWNLDNADRVDEAIQNAEYLYTLDTSQKMLPYNIGYLLGKVGWLGKAEFYYQRQLELEPEHWATLENLSFIQLLSGKLNDAKDGFEKFLAVRRKDYLDAVSYLEPENIKEMEDYFIQKSQKFSLLWGKALQLQGENTYTWQLQELNRASEVIIGANIAIEHNPFSMDNVLAMLGSGAQADLHEAQFQLAFQKRGDYSMRLTELISLIPEFFNLPKEAQSALVEGEKRFKDNDNGDFFIVIVSFSKALEICIKQFVFDRFRAIHQYQFKNNKQVIINQKNLPRPYQKFVSFLEKGRFIALGEMASVLELSTKPENEGIPFIRDMRKYLNEQGLQVLLVPEIVGKITLLAKDYRNKAVHSAMFDKVNAGVARELAIEVITSLKSN